MKKAVGHLVPFMEKEKEENIAKMKEQGLEIDEKVEHFTTDVTSDLSFCIGLSPWYHCLSNS